MLKLMNYTHCWWKSSLFLRQFCWMAKTGKRSLERSGPPKAPDQRGRRAGCNTLRRLSRLIHGSWIQEPHPSECGSSYSILISWPSFGLLSLRGRIAGVLTACRGSQCDDLHFMNTAHNLQNLEHCKVALVSGTNRIWCICCILKPVYRIRWSA